MCIRDSYDTIKGGDYRAREANVDRLAEVSNSIIDQCVAQGVPFAREYGGLLDNRCLLYTSGISLQTVLKQPQQFDLSIFRQRHHGIPVGSSTPVGFRCV